MKFICLGYYDEKQFAAVPQREQEALMDECVAYDETLQKGGHFAGGHGLGSHRSAKTLRHQNGKTVVTDGPYAETKEQIGGILILEAKDLDEAVQLMSRHPGVKNGPFEIRPLVDLSGMVEASRRRRGVR